jgi:hypothetical protein
MFGNAAGRGLRPLNEVPDAGPPPALRRARLRDDGQARNPDPHHADR